MIAIVYNRNSQCIRYKLQGYYKLQGSVSLQLLSVTATVNLIKVSGIDVRLLRRRYLSVVLRVHEG